MAKNYINIKDATSDIINMLFNKFLQISNSFQNIWFFLYVLIPFEGKKLQFIYCLCTDIKGTLQLKVTNQNDWNLAYILHTAWHKSHISFKAMNKTVLEIWIFSSRVLSRLITKFSTISFLRHIEPCTPTDYLLGILVSLNKVASSPLLPLSIYLWPEKMMAQFIFWDRGK